MKIKSLEFCALIFIIMQACLFGFTLNDPLKLLGNNAWITPIIGSIIGFIILLLFLYIYNYKSYMNINELNIYLFGNKIGKLINCILIIASIIFMVSVFWVLTSFISSQFLYNTPPIFIELLFILTVVYVLHHGINSFFRTVLILFYIVVFIHIINIIGLFRQAEIKNIMPFFNTDFPSVIRSVFNYVSFTILPFFFILIIPKNKIESNNLNKKIIITYALANISMFIVIFMILAVFGINLCNLYEFPGYHILKRVFEGAIIERFENLLMIFWLLIMFISITFGAYYFLKSLKDNFKIDKGKYIILILVLYFSHYLFKNTTTCKNWNENGFPIVAYITLLGIPLIIFFRILYKKRLNKSI